MVENGKDGKTLRGVRKRGKDMRAENMHLWLPHRQVHWVGKALRLRVLHYIQVLDDVQSKDKEEDRDGMR